MNDIPRIVAILETMWNWRGMTSEAGYKEAPRFFHINRENHSGRRLYKLVGTDARLLVTNACRELGGNANYHGKGDPVWLAENLERIDRSGGHGIDILLVCGKIAQKTYSDCIFTPRKAHVIEIAHPAARNWSKEKMEETISLIQEKLKNKKPLDHDD